MYTASQPRINVLLGYEIVAPLLVALCVVRAGCSLVPRHVLALLFGIEQGN